MTSDVSTRGHGDTHPRPPSRYITDTTITGDPIATDLATMFVPLATAGVGAKSVNPPPWIHTITGSAVTPGTAASGAHTSTVRHPPSVPFQRVPSS